jgi:hypothetical protein
MTSRQADSWSSWLHFSLSGGNGELDILPPEETPVIESSTDGCQAIWRQQIVNASVGCTYQFRG